MSWEHRSSALELMDTTELSDAQAEQILKALEGINRWLGGVRATLYHLRRYAGRWTSPVRILDWGTGGADVPRAIVRWARATGRRADVVAVDKNPAVVRYAIGVCKSYPEIKVIQDDLRTFDHFSEPFDYVISSLCLHHLSDTEIIELLRRSDQIARRGIIMNDLRRSRRAWLWIWALSRIAAPPMVQHDGPLSVRRAFRPEELRNLAQQAGVTYLDVHNHFGYRLTLAGEKIWRPNG